MNNIKINKRIKYTLVFAVLFLAIFFVAKFALAQASPDLGLDYAAQTDLSAEDPRIIAARIIRIFMGFLGIIAVGIIMYAGWLWMTASGNSERIETAKKLLLGAVIGLIIILSAFAIASFILSKLLEATSGEGLNSTPSAPYTLPGGGCPGCSSDGLIPCDGNVLTATCEKDVNKCHKDTQYCGNDCYCRDRGGWGASCNATSTPGVCEADNDMCMEYLDCKSDQGCRCFGPPVIESLSPVKNDASSTPNGAPGNLITITGRYFGTATGSVYFFDDSTGSTTVLAGFPHDINPLCIKDWQDGQIIVIVPNGAENGPIKVERPDSQYDTTDNIRGPFITDFEVNGLKRPGLCLANPDNGQFETSFTLEGLNFGLGSKKEIKFGSIKASTSADHVDFASGLEATAKIPDIKSGTTSVFVSIDDIMSNYLAMGIVDNSAFLPVISYIDPAEGAKGTFITIYGKNFLQYNTDISRVWFYNILTHASSTADGLDMPIECRDNWWHDKYIVVKVPSKVGLDFGTYKVTVTNARGRTSQPAPKDFEIINGLPGPGLCLLDPHNGPIDYSPVNVYGDYFGATSTAGVKGKAIFYDDILVSDTYLNSWTKQNVSVKVPVGSQTGPFRIRVNVIASTSNSLPFTVGKCASSMECEAGEACCQSGTYWDGVCRKLGAGETEETTCNKGKPDLGAYGWTFSTTPPQPDTCAGYTNAKACSDAGMCPNSPGQCQTSASSTVGNGCGNDYCKTKYPACATTTSCTYDMSKNICTTNIDCNEVVDTSGAKSQIYTGESINDFSNSLSRAVTIPGASIESDGANKVYAFTGKNHWGYSTEYIPVDTSRTYLISARFRAIGADPSITFLGFDPFDSNKREISAWEVVRYGSDETITAFDDTSISVAETISGWNSDGSIAGNRSLAFYYSGDTTKLPDAVHYWYPAQYSPLNGYYNPASSQGAYSTAIGNTIFLNTPIPSAIASRIIPGTTKIKNHSSGGSYLYTGADSGKELKNDGVWHEYGGNIIGEAFGNNANTFRPQTKFVKLIFGVNYDASVGQVGPAADKVLIDDLIFAPTSCNTVGGKSVFQIDTQGASCPQGSYLDYNKLCTLGTALEPKTCSTCPDGLTCNNGKCSIKQSICPNNSSCINDKCISTGSTCDCCCRVGKDNEDCCSGLKCTAGGCGAGAPNYGLCTGCKRDLNNDGQVTTPDEIAASDAACNCVAGKSNRYCLLDDANHPDGVCRDVKSCDANPNTAICDRNESACSQSEYCDPSSCTCKQGEACDSDTAQAGCQASNDMCNGLGSSYIKYCDVAKKCTCQLKYCNGTPNLIDQSGAAVCTASSTMCDAITEYCDNTQCICRPNPTPPGEKCKKQNVCDVGVPTCSAAAGFQCLSEGNTDCRCCCDPNATPPVKNPYGLSCYPNKTPCDGNQRGLFCGCEKDEQCDGGSTSGCGLDTCCRPRPKVESTQPTDNQPNVCRNAVLSATFDHLMSSASFTGEVVVVGDYGSAYCPTGTQYLTKQPESKTKVAVIFEKITAFIKKIISPIFNIASAYTTPSYTHNYCAVTGKVTSYNSPDGKKTTLEFTPSRLYDASTTYYVIIKGDTNTDDDLGEGVLDYYGVSMNGTSTEAFNKINYKNSYIWQFTTLPDQAENKGVCAIDHVNITPNSYLFNTNTNDLNEDDKSTAGKGFDTVNDKDKVFKADAVSSSKQNIAPVSGYSWQWEWLIDSTNIVDFMNGVNGLADNQKLIEAKQGITDGKTFVNADAVMKPENTINTGVDKKRGTASVWVFICENPWPAVSAGGTWSPWQDASDNCTIKTTPNCGDTGYEIYYCRDKEKVGTADDLPAILSDKTIVRSSSTVQNLLKEFYFFREAPMTQPSTNNFVVTPVSTGGAINASWQTTTGATGYKLYYGINSRNYSYYVSTTSTQTLINGLTDKTKYYFAYTSYNSKMVESGYSDEMSTTTADIAPSGAPQNVVAISSEGTINVSWTTNTDDAVGYKVYYGTASGVYGQSSAMIKTTKYTIKNLTNGKIYYVAVRAIDASKNESASTEVEIGTPPATPKDVKAESGDKQIKFSWSANTDNTTGYKIYYSQQKGIYNQSTQAIQGINYTVSGLLAGTTYYFKIVATNNYSNESIGYETIVATIPGVPQNLIATTSDGKIEITWDQNTDDTVGYKVYYGTTHGVYGQSSAMIKATKYTIKNLTNDKSYYVAVKAIDASKNESVGTEIIATPTK